MKSKIIIGAHSFSFRFFVYASRRKFRLLMLPPQIDRTHALARLIAGAVPDMDVISVETDEDEKR